MQEVEVKILDVDLDEIGRKLNQLGAKKTFVGEIRASYFDFPDESLRKTDKILRLRTKGKQQGELTFKQKLSREKAKIMDEQEISFSENNITTVHKILTGLGLQEFKTIQKYRTSYVLGDIHFELDKIPDIPLFLEIEATSLERLQQAVELLGFAMTDTKPWSGKDVLNHYRSATR